MIVIEGSRVSKYSLYCYFLAITGSILHYLPRFMGLQLYLNEYENVFMTPLSKGLQSKSFNSCVAISIGSSIPIFLDFLFDKLADTTQRQHPAKAAIWFVLLSSLMPNILLFAYIIPNEGVEYWPSTISLDSTILATTGCVLFNAYGSSIFTWNWMFVVQISVNIAQIMNSFLPFFNPNIREKIYYVQLIFYAVAILVITLLVIRWIKHILRKFKINIPLTADEIYCSFNLIVLIIAYLVLLLIGYTFVGSIDLELDAAGMSFRIVSFAGASIICMVLNSRHVRAILELEKATREAEVKRMLVGFFSHEIRTPLNSIVMGLEIIHREITNRKNNISNKKEKINDADGGGDSTVSLVEDLQGSCQSAVDILNDLLVYESLSGNSNNDLATTTMKITMKMTHGFSFLKQKINALTVQARQKDVKLEVMIIDELVGADNGNGNGNGNGSHDTISAVIDIDEAKFGQVIRNILSNAIECTPSGAVVSISVEVIRETQSQSQGQSEYSLRISVHDNGPEILESDRNSIFQNHLVFTAGILQTREAKGLGLWISHRVMELHKGRLYLESLNESSGNTFIIEIPIVEFTNRVPNIPSPTKRSFVGCIFDKPVSNVVDNEKHSSSRSIKSPIRNICPPFLKQKSNQIYINGDDHDDEDTSDVVSGMLLGKNGRVLVVDDAVMNRKMMCRLLVGHCDRTIEAEDGVIAVEKMRQALAEGPPFDLVLMDYQMPNMDGPTAAKRMREMGYDGLIIGVTGNTLPIHIETFVSQGANVVLPKPVHLGALNAALHNNL